jgi:3-oxoadipate enol-lactonase
MDVSVPDGVLWAEDTGGVGAPVVLVHADWTDSGIWSELVPLLRDRHRVIGYDLRGFGRSSRPERPFTRLSRDAGRLIATRDRDGHVQLGQRTWAPAGVDEAVTAMMRGAVSSWFEIGDLEVADPPGFARLGDIRIPAVMLPGDLEYPMVAAASRAIAARLDTCRTVLVPGADHLLPLRAPGLLAEVIAGAAG